MENFEVEVLNSIRKAIDNATDEGWLDGSVFIEWNEINGDQHGSEILSIGVSGEGDDTISVFHLVAHQE